MYDWFSQHYIEIFGAVAGIIFVFLEIRQSLWLWPVGILTSAVYIWVFFDSRFYADMGLQVYYLAISIYGWNFWIRGGDKGVSGSPGITSIGRRLAILLLIIFALLQASLWGILEYLTDSPVPVGDAFTTALSIIATWMLARKILQHWILWIVADLVSAVLYLYKGLYPTVLLFLVYTVLAFIGFYKWKKEYTLKCEGHEAKNSYPGQW